MIKFKNKVLAKVLGAFVIVGIVPTTAMAEEIQVNETVIQDNSQSSSSVTTKAAVQIETVDLDAESIKAKTALESIHANNDTHESDIIDTIKNNVDESVDVIFGTGTEDFGKIISSEQEEGSISGTIYLVDSLGNKKGLEVDLVIAKLESSETQKVTELKAVIEGNPLEVNVGQTIRLIVTGYNFLGEEVKLDETKLTYKWIVDGEVVGTDKELKITEELDGKQCMYVIDYPDDEEGGIK